MHTAEAVDKTPTGPPPPYHPASMHPAAAPAAPAKKDTPPETPLEAHLREGRTRLALVRSELSVGNLSREEAACVLRVELRAMDSKARE
jgi:hypothetical protein